MKLTLSHKKALIGICKELAACQGFKYRIIEAEDTLDIANTLKEYNDDIASKLGCELVDDETPHYDTILKFAEAEGIYQHEAIKLLALCFEAMNANFLSKFTGSIEDQWKLEKLLEHWDEFTSADVDGLFEKQSISA